MQAWETAREGVLTTRQIFNVTAGSGTFIKGETVTGGSSGCNGIYVPEDAAVGNGSVMTLDSLNLSCSASETLTGGTSGATATFNSVSSSDGTLELGELYNDSTFTGSLVIDGSTTDATHYMNLTVASGNRHNGTAGTGVKIEPSAVSHAVQILDDYTRVEWVEITNWTTNSEGSFDGINIQADNALIEYVIVHDDGNGTASNSDANGINLELDSMTATVRNSIVYSVARSGITIHNIDNATLNIENTTVYNCVEDDNLPNSYGCIVLFSSSGGTINAKNVISMAAQNGGEDFQGGSWGTSSNNISSDTTAPGTASITSASSANEFVSIVSGSENFHLISGADALATGADLSSNFTLDIDAAIRSTPWDVGADDSSAGINISGTCKQVNQSTDCTDTGTIRIAINGTLQAQTQTTVGGTWTISNISKPLSGDVITVYVAGAADNREAVAVSLYDGRGHISGIELIEEHLSIGNADNQIVSNTHLSQYDHSVSGSEDIFHEVNASNDLSVDTTGALTAEVLYIKTGNTYRPDSASSGNITTLNLENKGTIIADGNIFTVSGIWTNSGTFTGGTSTVVFSGGNQTITGSTTFHNFTKTESTNNTTDVILTFDNTGTQTISGLLTLDGLDADDRILLVSNSPGNEWNLSANGTFAIDNVRPTDSDASGGTVIVHTSTTDGGNNSNWGFTVAVSGTVYTDDDEMTGLGGQAVRLLIDGNDSGLTATTDGAGNYTINAVPSAGQTLLAYLDTAGGNLGTTVSVSDGGAIPGFNIYQNHVITRQDNGGALSNANMSTATNGDTDIQYTSSSGTLTANGTGVELYVPLGHRFTPGGTANLMDLENAGTINAGSNSIDVTGNFLQSSGTFNADSADITAYGNWTYVAGTFNQGTSKITFYSQATNTITGNHILNDVTFAGPGGGFPSNFTIAPGTTITIAGTMILGDVVNNPPIILNTGNIDAKGDIRVNTTSNAGGGDATLTINGGGAQTLTGSGIIRSGFIPKIVISKISGTLNIASIISTGEDWTYTSGLISAGSSTLVFDSGVTQTIMGSHTLANLIFSGPGGGWDPSYTIASGTTLTLTGNLGIATAGGLEGPIDVNTGTIQVEGNINIGATATGGSAAIVFSGSNNQSFTSSGDAPDGLYTVNKLSGTVTLASAMNLNGVGQDLSITQGTLDLAGFDLTVNDVLTVEASGILQLEGGETTVSSSTLTLNTGSTVLYDGGGSYTGLKMGNIYSNLSFNNAGGTWTLNNALDVNNNLTLNNGTLDVSVTNYQINVAGNWNNSGTLTARSGTVVFDGTNQTITGSTTFNNFSKTESTNNSVDAILTFDNTATQTIGGLLTLDGLDADDRINLVSDSPGNQWNLTANGTFAIDFVEPTDSDASGGTTISHTNTVDGGNNLNWGFAASISGAVYTDEGTIPIANGALVRLLINGVDSGTGTTSGGVYNIPANPSAGDALLVYIDGHATDGTTVTVSSGGAMTGLNIYGSHLITRHDNGSILSNALMNTAKTPFADAEILYSISGSDLTVNGSGTELYVLGSHSFTPGGNVTTPAMENLGTFNGGSGTIDINGTLTVSGGAFTATSGTTNIANDFIISSGTFAHNAGTLVFDGGSFNVNIGTEILNDVEFTTVSSNNVTVTGTMDINGNLTITSVTNIDGGTITVAGNVTSTDADVRGTALIRLDGTGTLGAASGTGDFPNIEINTSGTITMQDRIQTNDWTYVGGTVNAGSSTVDFDGTSFTVNSGAMSFNHVEVRPGSSDTLTIIGTMDINGDLTIARIRNVNGGTITVAGNLTSTDSGVNGTTAITLDGGGTQNINVTGDLPDGIFTINKTPGTAAVLLANFTTALDEGGQDLIVTQGILDLSGFNLSVPDVLTVASSGTLQLEGGETTVSYGTLTLNTGSTVFYDGGGNYTGLKMGNAYSNLTFDNAGGTWVLGAALDVNSNLTMTNGTLDVSGSDFQVNVAGNWNNSGTLTARSGTVVFDGTNQAITGSTTFNNFSKTESTDNGIDAILTFDNTGTQTISGLLTLDGLDADDRINLVSDSPGNQWNLTANGTFAIDFVEPTDSDASGGTTISHTNTVDGGNNLNWGFAASISGTVYTDEGTVLIANGAHVRLLINGIDSGTGTTSGGVYNIPANPSAGDALIVYIDGHATDGTTVTVSSGGAMTGLNIYGSHLITRHDNGGILTNALMNTAKTPFADAEILYSISGSDLTVNGSGTELYVLGSHSFTPGGNVTTPAMENLGTFNGGSGTIDINGTLTVSGGAFTATSGTTNIANDFIVSSGTFTHNAGTLIFDGGSFNVNIGTEILNDVEIITVSSDTLTVIGTMDINGNLTITNIRTVNGGTITVAGNLTSTDSGVDGTALIRLDGTGILGASGGTGDFPNIEINTSGTITMQDTIQTTDWTYIGGTVNEGSSTVEFDSASFTVNSGSMRFNHAEFNAVSANATIIGTMDINGNLTITTIGNVNGGTITVAGNLTSTDTSVSGTAVIRLDGTGIFGASGGTGDFPNIEINTSGTITMQDTIQVNDWIYVGGTVNAGSSTVEFDSTSLTVNSGSMRFNDVEFRPGTSDTATIIGTMDIGGNLTITTIDNMNGGTITVAGNLTSTDSGVNGTTAITLDGGGTQNINVTGDLPDGIFTINKTLGTTAVLLANFTTALDGVGQDLTITQGTLDLSGFNLRVPDVLSVASNGTLQLEGGETTVSYGTLTLNTGSTVLYDGGGNYTGLKMGNAYSSLAFDNAGGTWALDAPLDVNSNLTITNGTLDVSVSDHQINVAGNWNNSGTLTARSGTVVLDGINQTIMGSTTFNNFSKTESTNNGTDAILTFDNAATQTISGLLTLDGLDADDRINLVSDSPSNQWGLTANGTFAIDFVEPTDSDASGGSTIAHINTVDGGNNLNWAFSAAIAGTVYTDDDEAMPLTSKLVRLLINGSDSGLTATTDGVGNYSISATTNAGDILLVYLDDETEDGTTVTVSNGGALSGLNIYQNHVVTREDNGGTLSNANLSTATNVDTDIQYSVSAGNLTVTGSHELYIPGSHSFAPSGNITTSTMESLGTFIGGSAAIDINGTLLIGGGSFTASSGTMNISGNLTISGGTFTHNSGTIVIDGNSTINIGAASLNHLTLNAGSSNVTVTGTVDLDGNLTITSANALSGGTYSVAGNVTSTDTAFSGVSSLIVFDGTGAQVLGAAGSSGIIPSVSINKASGTLTFQDTIGIEGSNASFTWIAGTVVTTGSTVQFLDSNQAIDASGMRFDNVVFNTDGNVTVTGIMLIDGNVSISSINGFIGGTLSIAGNVTTIDSTLSGSSGTFLLNGTGNQTISASGGTGALSNVTINKTSGTLSILDTINLYGDWTYTTGAVSVDPGNSIAIVGSGSTISSGSMAFNHISMNTSGNVTIVGTMDVNGNLTTTATNQLAGGTITVAGNLSTGDSSMGSGSNTAITLDGMGVQIITTPSGDRYPGGTFTINKASDTAQLSGDFILSASSQDLTITQGTLDLNGFNLNVADVLTVDTSGTLQLEGGETTIAFATLTLNTGSTVLYDGGGGYTGLKMGNVYSNLSFNNAGGTWTLNNALDVNNNLTITNGTLDVSATNYQINLAGNWSNSGTLTARSGTVILDGTNQSITGSTTFNNFTKTESTNNSTDAILTFDNTATQTISGTLTLDGLDTDDRINLVSDSPGNQWSLVLSATASKAIDFVDVQDSDASGSNAGQLPVSPMSGIDSGNNIQWFVGVTGRVYTDDTEVTPLTGKRVNLLVNGASVGTAMTNSLGVYSISATPSLGDTVLVFLDNETEDGTTVTVSGGSSVSNLNIYQNHIVTRHDNSGALTNTNMATANNGDTDIQYSVSSGNLTVIGNHELHVLTGHGFTPGGNVTAIDVDINGTFNPAAFVVNVSGNWDATGGVFTTTGTVTFNGTADQTITNGGTAFNHLVLNNTGGVGSDDVIVSDALDINGNLTITNGDFDIGTNNPAVNTAGNVTIGSSGSIDVSSRTANWTFDGTSILTDGSTGGPQDLQDVAITGTGLILGSSALIETMNIQSGSTVFLGNSGYVLEIDGTGGVGSGTGTFDGGLDSITRYTGTGASVTLPSGNYHDLQLQPSAANTFLMSSNLTGSNNLSGNLIIDSNAILDVTASNYNIDLAGNWINNGSFLARSGTVTFSGTGTQSITSAGNPFNNLTVTNASNVVTFTDSFTTGNLTAVTPSTQLTFTGGTTNTISGILNLDGQALGTEVLLRSTNTTQYILDVTGGAQTVRFVDVQYSDAGSNDITSNLSTNSGNNDDAAASPHWIFSVQITGTVYTDEGLNPIADGATVHLLVNGVSVVGLGTTVLGAYAISSGALNANDAILVYIDNHASDGVAVTVSDGLAFSGFDIYADHVITRHDNGGSLVNANMSAALGSYVDADILYSVTGGNLTVTGSGTELFIPVSHSFIPTGDVTTPNLENRGTFNGGSGTVDVNGSLTLTSGTFTATSGTTSIGTGFTISGGTFVHNAGTVNFDTASATINIGTAILNNLTLALGAGILTVSGTVDVDGDFSMISAGNVNGGSLLLAGNLSSVDASVDGTTTITLDGTGTQNINVSGDLPDGLFTINKASGIAILMANFTAALDGAGQDLRLSGGRLDLNGFNLTVPDVLTVDGSETLQLEGSETVSTATSTFSAGSTVLFDGTGTYLSLAAGNTYSNLTLNGVGGTWSQNAALDVNGNLNITNGTLNSAGNTLNIAGNWTNAGTYTSGANTVIFDGTNQSITGSTTFNNFTKTDSTNDAIDLTLTFDNTTTQTVNGTFTLNGLDADDRINLVSDSPGNQWSLVLSATASKAVDFVDVQDSDASGSAGALIPVNPINALDSGNNTQWFGTALAATSTLVEVTPNLLAIGSPGNIFIYDLLPTIGGSDTGIDEVTLTLPSGYANLLVSGVTVGGTAQTAGASCPSVGGGEYCMGISGQVLAVALGTKVTTTLTNIRITFTADVPVAVGSANFTSTIDDSGTSLVPQLTTVGNADGDAADNNSITVQVVGRAVTSVLAEIAPNVVPVNTFANTYFYDFLPTMTAGDTGFNEIALTAPSGHTNISVTGLSVGGTALAVGASCTTPGAQYCVSIAGQVMTVTLVTPVTSSLTPIRISFTADAPTTVGSGDFTAVLDDIATITAAQAVTVGNADGDAADVNSITVATGNLAASAALAEINPTTTVMGTTAKAFTLDLLPTINAADTGIDQIELTAPAAYANLNVTGLSVGGVNQTVGSSCLSLAAGEYCIGVLGQVMTVTLGRKIMTSLSNIQVRFTADVPGVAGSAIFAEKFNDTGTATVVAQAATEGNADGDVADANSLSVTVQSIDGVQSLVSGFPRLLEIDRDGDGNPYSTITVIPKDSSDINLGPGLNVVISAVESAVSSGKLLAVKEAAGDPFGILSPVIDNGDGSYSAQISSAISGIATVSATVNGVQLQSSDTVIFTAGQVLKISKTANKKSGVIGDVVTYQVVIQNTTTQNVFSVSLNDKIPPGFKYLKGSTLVNGQPAGDPSGVQTRVFNLGTIVAWVDQNGNGLADTGDLGAMTLSYQLVIGSGVKPGEHENRAQAYDFAAISNQASAKVRVDNDPIFDLSTLIGKVFFDKNKNGYQDRGEAGVGAAQVVLDNGTYVITDDHGRYHFPGVRPGQRLLKINTATLPPGTTVTTEVARIVEVSRGLLTKVNFGVVYDIETERIGREGKRGIAVSSKGQIEPTQVTGYLESMKLLVNGDGVKLPLNQAYLGVGGLEETVEIIGENLSRPIPFSITVETPDAVETWRLEILDAEAEIFALFQGEGAPPKEVRWDGKNAAQNLMEGGGIYFYQFKIDYKDGSSEASAKRIFGVNLTSAISLNLLGSAFAVSSAEINAKTEKALHELAETLKKYPNEKITIEGHTDNTGSEISNLELSKARAEAAMNYLVEKKGISKKRFEIKWFGEEKPMASNRFAEGRTLNRRVEIVGAIKEVKKAKILRHPRSDAVMIINGLPVKTNAGKRFSMSFAQDVSSLDFEMASPQGEVVKTKLIFPSLEITAPAENEVMLVGERNERYLALPRNKGGRYADGLPVASYRLQGLTEVGNQVWVDGKRVKVAPNGVFETDILLKIGENIFTLVASNVQHVSRMMTLKIDLSDTDEEGRVMMAVKPIPQISVLLPPKGKVLSYTELPLRGMTDPGNAVWVNQAEMMILENGTFSTSVQLKEGDNVLQIEVRDPEGFVSKIEREVRVETEPFFLMALADGEFGQISTSGYLEGAGASKGRDYYAKGRLAYYLKGKILGKYLITSAFDSGKNEFDKLFQDLDQAETNRFFTNIDPDKFYPVYGDESTVVYDAQTQGKFYLAIEGEDLNVLVGNYKTGFNETELAAFNRTLYGGRFEYRSLSKSPYGAHDTKVVVFAAQVRQAHVQNTFRATGGSLYYLSEKEIIEGSEQVRIEVRDQETGLVLAKIDQVRDADYSFKYEEGRILFRRPISSVVSNDLLLRQESLQGHPVFVLVDFEYEVQGFDKSSVGARVRQQLGDHFAVGGTAIDDTDESGEYELRAVDAEVRLGQGTSVVGEYAESMGKSSATLISDDGGLSFTPIATAAVGRGEAYKIAVRSDLSEWFGEKDRLLTNVYYKRLSPEFFSNGTFLEQGTLKYGGGIKAVLSKRDVLRFRYDFQEVIENGNLASANQVGAKQVTVKEIEYDHRRGPFFFTAGFQDKQIDENTGLSKIEQQLTGRVNWEMNDRVVTSIRHQQRIRGKDAYRTTLGVKMNLAQWLDGVAEGAHASDGDTVLLGFSARIDERSTIYSNETFEKKQGQDATWGTVVGGDRMLAPRLKLYGEYGESRGNINQTRSLWGLDQGFGDNKKLKINLNYERSYLKGITQNTTRDSASVSLRYRRPDGSRSSHRIEVRFEKGADRKIQRLTTHRGELKILSGLTLFGKFNFSDTQNKSQDRLEARFTEAGGGVAYRPITFDRLNLITKYTFLLDEKPDASAVMLKTSAHVTSLEAIYDFSRYFQWVQKYAVKIKKERQSPRPNLKSQTDLWINRINFHVNKSWDIGVEYRILKQSLAKDQLEGYAVEINRAIAKYFRLGVGYNFSRFSDNEFSDNNYDARGWFFRVQGKY